MIPRYYAIGPDADLVIAEFIFAGSTYYPASMSDEFCVYWYVQALSEGDDVTVSLYDLTNSNELASIQLTAAGGGYTLSCDTTFSNIPAARAVMQIRFDKAGTAGEANVYFRAYEWARYR